MEFGVHQQVLLSVFVVAVIAGAVANKTNFCTMGAVSDWVNMGDSGRMRAWLLAMAVAIAGVLVLQATGSGPVGTETFPPYRTPAFAWLRYIVGGLMFGVGMTLASGCGGKTLIRVGGGNLKSVVVLAVAAVFAYLMLWTDFYGTLFHPWVAATTYDLAAHGVRSQALGDVVGGIAGMENTRLLGVGIGWAAAIAIAAFVFASRDFRESRDNIIGGLVVGLAVVVGWWLTTGSTGQAWKEYAEFAASPPSRVEAQSFTFISPMGDGLRYLMSPTQFGLINFGIMALTGVIVGSFLYAVITKGFRVEWFANRSDAINHVIGGMLMGVGGVLAMGCTIGQAISGVSTLALGSFLAFAAIVAGAAATMKYQYWRMMNEA